MTNFFKLILIIVLSCSTAHAESLKQVKHKPGRQEKPNKVVLFDTVVQCKQEAQYSCHGACEDGWGTSCYYDNSKSKIEDNQSLDSQKDKCFGYYDRSVCQPCRNIYLIENKNVSCKEFYESINKKNKECQRCLKTRFIGGG